jgi:hypothetical protein
MSMSTAMIQAAAGDGIEAAIRREHEAASAAVIQAPECPLRRIHREWKADCERRGYDVDANRREVEAILAAKGNETCRWQKCGDNRQGAPA